MQIMIDQIKKQIHVSPELEAAIKNAFKKIEFIKNKHIIKEGQYCSNLYFLESGVVRSYYWHNDKEVSSWFYKEDQYFTSWYSFFSQYRCFENFQAISDCIIYSIDDLSLKKLRVEFPEFEKFGRILAEEQISFMDYFYKGYMFMSAKEKYDLLLEYFPDVELHVNLGHIASYLGISQETLSRVRSQKSS